MVTNKTNPKRIAILAAAAVLLTGTFALTAAPRPRGGQRGSMLGLMLDLTDAQKEQAKAIFEETRKSNEAYREQIKALRQEERAAIKAGKSEAELRNLALSGANLMANLHANRLAGKAKFWKILTPEQQAKLESMGEKMRGRMERFRNRGQQE